MLASIQNPNNISVQLGLKITPTEFCASKSLRLDMKKQFKTKFKTLEDFPWENGHCSY